MPSAVIPEGMMNAKSVNKASRSKWHKRVFQFMDSGPPQLFFAVMLMLSLFMADSWILGNAPDSLNDTLYSILLAIFVVFSLETIILSVVKEGYFLGFFFWMDIVGTLSIILDIGWIANRFIPAGTLSSQSSVLRVTRVAKLGARYGRLLRLIRSFRNCCLRQVEDTEPTMSAIKKVSTELTNMLSLRTAGLVMILVIVLPFLNYNPIDYSANAWITNMKILAKNETVNLYEVANLARKAKSFYRTKNAILLYFSLESPFISDQFERHYKTRRILRSDNVQYIISEYYIANSTLQNSPNSYAASYISPSDLPGYTKFQVQLNMDVTLVNQIGSMFGIVLILSVIVVLFVFTASFSNAVTELVVNPLEQMMISLRSNAMLMLNALKSLEHANKSNDEDDVEKKKRKKKEQRSSAAGDSKIDNEDYDSDDSSDEDEEAFESAMLEKMVEKLARIVKHVIPASDDVGAGANLDKDTSNWLAQSYTTGNAGIRTVKQARESIPLEPLTEDDTEGKQRLQDMETALTLVSKEHLNSWDFDVLKYSHQELNEIITYLFSHLNLLDEFKVSRQIFRAFLNEISGTYINNTYHNYHHGCDVCHTSYRLIMIPQLDVILTAIELFAMLVGALAHDVGHPGVNNLFLVKSKHELALQHNDRSPLENMHCVVLYGILAKDTCNIFVNLKEAEWRETRKIMLTIILGTDMSHHFEQISKTQLFYEVHGEDTKAFCTETKDQIDCLADDKNRLFLMELVLHCSDISNPFKPYALCARWADLVVEEFCLQGDKEKSMGIEVSPMCDREQISLCNMQMGFIEFVVAPLIIAFVNILPSLHELGSNMNENFQQWGQKRVKELLPPPPTATGTANTVADNKPEEVKKLEERMQKFSDRLSFVQEFQTLPTRKRGSAILLRKQSQSK